MAEQFFVHEFDNGLTLLGQRMEQVSSAALTLALAGGASRDPSSAAGAAAVGAYWMLRGAGERDTRELNEALDSLGCRHHEDTQSEHLVLSAGMLGRNLPPVLPVVADVIRRPHLSDESFGPCRDLIVQELDGLEDEPMRKCHLMIRDRFYPCPLGRSPLGTRESLQATTAEQLREHVKTHLTPRKALMAVAGKFDWDALVEAVGEHFGDWAGGPPPDVTITDAQRGIEHVTKPTAQVQITLAYPAATVNHPRYYAARVAQMVLSGGMSSRLFTEVREKRALVYSILARYHSLKDHAGMFVYAGTAPERAQETLDVTVAELRRLAEGVTEAELARAKTQLRSALIMQGESTGARSEALVGDWYHLRRLRPLEELSAAVEAVTAEDVIEYVRAFPAAGLTVLTIGPEELDTSALG